MKRTIFRRAAIERLASPEQLDQLVRITTPKGWLALMALSVLLVGVLIWAFVGTVSEKVYGHGILLRAGGVLDVEASVSGILSGIYVDIGQEVQKGQVVARIVPEGELAGEKIICPYAGRIVEIKVREASHIDIGTSILTVELTGSGLSDLEAIVYVPPQDGERIEPGMDAQVTPASMVKQESGFILGKVTAVGDYPATYQGMLRTLGSEELVQSLQPQDSGVAPIEVHITLTPTQSGYKWSTERSSDTNIQSGMHCSVSIVVSRQRRPIDLILPSTQS
jgi:multidrug efflux pump subunit AcrA (membrane-fusion protein)